MKYQIKIRSILAIAIAISFSSECLAQLPQSKQASLVETVSSSEVLIEATGIFKSKQKREKKAKAEVNKIGVEKATVDAKKSAVYFILFGGTDPLISTSQERQKFDQQMVFYFDSNNITRYITFEENLLLKKVKTDGGKGIKVTKRFKVNKSLIVTDLEAHNILEARADLAELVGNPFIMVIPSTQKGQNPVELLMNDPKAKHAASVIESYLTARQYDVVVPEQQASLEGLADAQLALGDREEDISYSLALSIGSDVYITYSLSTDVAGFGTEKYVSNVRAYETTTARLLGTETGYSQGRQGEINLSIEEAINDAIDKVLSRISNYWKSDLKRGIQYKLVFNISTDFDDDEVEDIQFALMDAAEAVSKSSKENIATAQTLDYLIWCDPEGYDKSSKVYRNIKKAFDDEGLDAKLRRLSVNRKMILLKVDYE